MDSDVYITADILSRVLQTRLVAQICLPRSPECPNTAERIKNRVLVYLLIAWVTWFLAVAFTIYSLFSTDSSSHEGVLSPFTILVSVNETTLTVVSIFYVVIYAYLQAAFLFVTVTNCIIADVITYQYTLIAEEFDLMIDKNGRLADEEYQFETMRRKHQTICGILKDADRILCRCYAASTAFEVMDFFLVIMDLVLFKDPCRPWQDHIKSAVWIYMAVAGFGITALEGVKIGIAVSWFC